jgi:23S rRNA (guanosine2251-2'-O)-methyltransferase
MNRYYIYGINSVKEAVLSGKRQIFKIVSSKDKNDRVNEIIEIARTKKIFLDSADNKTLDRLANNGNHQGIVAEVSPLKRYDILEALKEEKGIKNKKWLAIDSITDANNVGSLIRSALCLGFTSLILGKNRTINITPAVEKISSGAIERIKIIEVVNLNQTIIELKEKGFWIYGSAKDGKSIIKENFSFPLLLVIGSEDKGLHQKTKEHCDEIIAIPQIKDFDSLNAAVSGAILMYEIYKRDLELQL